MKKALFILIIIGIYLIIGGVAVEGNLIPDGAIRIRVIANSDTNEDQKIKEKVKKELENYYYNKLKDVRGVSNAITTIKESIPEVRELIINTLGTDNYDVNYGMNYFPAKEYRGVPYKEGYYQSLVVKLGEGVGGNWWCVLFPPLCLLEGTETTDVEYRSLIADMIDKYF